MFISNYHNITNMIEFKDNMTILNLSEEKNLKKLLSPHFSTGPRRYNFRDKSPH